MRVLVLGGGPAGATAALQARELGADVTLVDGVTGTPCAPYRGRIDSAATHG